MRTRIFIGLAVVAVIAASLFFTGALGSRAYAQDGPAVVINDFGCSGFVPNGSTPTGFPDLAWLFTTESHAVRSASGNQILTCHFDHQVDLDKATQGEGFLCSTAFGLTVNTHMVATPGGKATLICKVNGSD